MKADRKIDFGFAAVAPEQQESGVRRIFSGVAPGYDAMNDIMSLAMHRLWKWFAVYLAEMKPGQDVLDVAGGTGDMARLCKRRVGTAGRVVLMDSNPDMLAYSRARDIEAGTVGAIEYVMADAVKPPFAAASFDWVVIAFGLRNFSARGTALAAMHSLLRPGGKMLLLEFSTPDSPLLARMFRFYCLKVMPLLGKLYLQDEDSYRYLGESIHSYPDRHKVSDMLCATGYDQVQCNVLSGGIVTIHRAVKP